MRSLKLILLTALAITLTSSALCAWTFIPVTDAHLADGASLIARARVEAATVHDRVDGVVTLYRMAPLEIIKGDPTTPVLRVRVMGGMTSDGRGQVFDGLPRFALGEEVLVFLRAAGAAETRLAHLGQGVFFPAEHQGQRYWARSAMEGGGLSIHGFGAKHHTVPRQAGAFVRWLADRAAGNARPADYLATELPALPLARPTAKYTLSDPNQPIRWFEFDGGGFVRWFRHSEGQRGTTDGGIAAFAAARATFNNQPDTPLILLDSGTTNAIDGFNRSDGRNTILFRDIGNRIGESFDCATGGTLALGGFSFVAGGNGRPWKGRVYRVGVEAEIVVNDGIECLLATEPLALAQIYGHELGHTLGLGHSCGDASSPSCTSNAALPRALMRARFPAHPWGAQLRSDDVEGLRFLYDRSFDDTGGGGGGNGGGDDGGGSGGGGPSSCDRPNGHPRRCTECGPCGTGEGDCDADAECAAGLICAADRGADFGFNPNIDVCLASGGGGGGNGGGGSTCALPAGHPRYCDDCGPCVSGAGDCDRDSDCRAGLVCAQNVGAQFGFAPGIDVCLAGDGGGACSVDLGRRFYCAMCGGCGSGEGDCDTDADCRAGLQCVQNVGAQFGFAPKIDVCL